MAITWTNRKNNDPIYLSLTAGTLTLSLAGHTNLSFDGEGRLVGAWFDGVTYRRGLDNRVLMKWVEDRKTGIRQRRFLDTEERRALLERSYAVPAMVQQGIREGTVDPGETPPETVAAINDWLTRVTSWSWPRLEGERERFARVYKPISILPPDQYLALVIQATEGCSYNECSFCTFYRDRPFRIHTPADFGEHITAVKEFLGQGVRVRKTLFLADANAVIIPQNRLLPLLDRVNQAFPILPINADAAEQAAWRAEHPWSFNGVYAFISAPDALRKDAADFAAMRARNVRRLYVGLETGHDPLRRFLRKQGTAGDALAAVRAIKGGGVEVGLIFMVGVGGEAYREAHFRDTVALLKEMPLGDDDLIYVSPFVASDDSPYVADAAHAGIAPLDDEALDAERQRFIQALRPWARERGVRVSHYDIREFLY